LRDAQSGERDRCNPCCTESALVQEEAPASEGCCSETTIMEATSWPGLMPGPCDL
jgi:hypothetical protein